MNKVMFMDYKNDEHYGDAKFENFPRLQSIDGMSKTETLEIKNKGKAAGTIKVEVSLQLKSDSITS